MAGNDKQITGNAAMFHACWELSRRGWNVMPTVRNAKGSDMFIMAPDESRVLGIQSKGFIAKEDVSLGMKPLSELLSDWWIMTTHCRTDAPRSFILSLDEVRAMAVTNKGGSQWLCARDFMLPEFESAWGRIGTVRD